MRALVVTPGRQQIAVTPWPEPVADDPSRVLLRVLDVAVCGTDREIARFDYGTPHDGQEGLVLGTRRSLRSSRWGTRSPA